ncbi:hypothetical protein QOZ80_8BG0662510 [Eleusine coracana subsp. coracana]|nr:hypothetical protein QOZ80_8BG0662510 [Eleusine coracana subsp. coracana]
MANSPPTRKPRLAADAAAPPPDLLSSLPLKVLDNILSRLHIRAVVRTSALSRACRSLWESLPSVDLTSSFGIVPANVDSLLLRRSAPVRTFSLVAYDGSWFVDALHDWLLYLSRNGVRNLNLWFPWNKFRLHSSLFSCRELTSLNLNSCRHPPTPLGFAGFPCLKTLNLHNVVIPEHGGRHLEALIGESPLMEKVELMRVELIGDDPDEEWLIRGPNLQELTIVSDFPYGGSTEDLPRLKEAGLFGPNYAKFLMGMAGVTKLDFFCVSNWLTEVDVLDRLPFLFKNLTSLVVAVNFTKMAEILSIFCLFRSAPSIEDLTVWGFGEGKQEIDADNDFLNAQWADCMFLKLRVVQMKKIVCLCNELQFMEFILSKARALQVLSIMLSSSALCSNEEAITHIIEYPRASPDAQVIFLGRESANNGSANTSSETAEAEESHTTDSEHDSINSDTDDDDSEEEEVQTTSSEPGSIGNSTTDDASEERHISGSRIGSICMSPDNAEVGYQRASVYTSTGNAEVGSQHDSVNTSTDNAAVEETQTTGSGLVHFVHPRRRQRLDLESVVLLGQLEEEMLELQEQMQLESTIRENNSLIQQDREHMISKLQDLSTNLNISLPPLPAFLSHMATSRQGDTSVNPGFNGATSAHGNSPHPEDRAVNGAGNAHTCSSEHA